MKKRIFLLTVAFACATFFLTTQAYAMNVSIEIRNSTSSGENPIALNVEPTDRIEDVKTKIQEKAGEAYNRWGILFDGKLLQEGNTLQDYNIPENSTLQLVEPVTLDISRGSILIKSSGYSINGEETAFVGPYILTGKEDSTTYYNVQIESGTHEITLDNLEMDNVNQGWGIAIGKKDQTASINVTMTFAGENTIRAGGAGSDAVPILVLDQCSLTLRGENENAVLNAIGTSDGKAAIGGPWDVFQSAGGDGWQNDRRGCGNIIIESGTIYATGGGNGAAVIGIGGNGEGYNSSAAVTVNDGDLHLEMVDGGGFALGGATGNLALNGGTITTAGQYPLANEDVVINGDITFSGAGVTVSGGKKLTVNESGSLTIEKDAVLTVDGTLDVDNENALLTNQGIVNGNGTVSGVSLTKVALTANKTEAVPGETITLMVTVSEEGTNAEGTVTIGSEKKPLSDGKAEFLYTVPEVSKKTVQKLTVYYYQGEKYRNGASTSITIYPPDMPELDIALGSIEVRAAVTEKKMIVSQNGKEWLVSTENPVVVTGESAGYASINVNNVDMTLLLRDMSTESRIWINNASVVMTLKGENRICFSEAEQMVRDAVDVDSDSSLTINGAGSLTTNGKISVYGDLKIQSGTVNVNIPKNEFQYPEGSVAIGTEYGDESSVIISGGTVIAMVPETTSDFGEFGGSWGIKSHSVTITGGSVNASSISPAPTDGTNEVYPVSISSLPPNGEVEAIYLSNGSGQVNYGCPTTVFDDGTLILYLTAGTYKGEVLVDGKLYTIDKISVAASEENPSFKTANTGITITLPQDEVPSFDESGRLELPENSVITNGDGSIVAVPNGGTVSSDGSITVPSAGTVIIKDDDGSTTTITAPEQGSTIAPGENGDVIISGGSTVQTGAGPAITIGPNTSGTVDSNGSVTVSSGGSIQVGDTTITLPTGGGTVTPNADGTLTVPGGSTVTTGDVTTTVPDNGGTVKPDAGLTLTVTFDSQGGAAVTSQTIVSGGKITAPAAPTRSGYTFDGWYKDAACTVAWDFDNDVVTVDITLYAKWTENNTDDGNDYPSIPSTPDNPGSEDSQSWSDIQQEVQDAAPGSTVEIDMEDTAEVPGDFLETLAGRDVTVTLAMGDGILWTIDGQDLSTNTDFDDVDLGVTMNTDGIPAEVVNAVSGDHPSVQITLSHDGPFGFVLTLTAPLGEENAGFWANLYHYDEDAQALTFEMSGVIAEDGSVQLQLSHASQYAIVIDDHSHAALPFSDVRADDWFYDVVGYVYNAGLMTGTSDDAFSPNVATSRGMIVAILHRLEGSPTVTTNAFSDVSSDDWYAQAVNWAASEGIVGGFGDGTFAPNAPITREQMASILYRYSDYKGMDVSARADLSRYSDNNQIGDWSRDVLSWAVGEGLITGMTSDTIVPQGEATRAQVAAVLQRYLEM